MNRPYYSYRLAQPDDLNLLIYWDRQPHVILSDHDDPWEWTREDLAANPPWRTYWIMQVDGRDVGVIQIIDPALEETHYWGEMPPNQRALDIWIGEATDLGKGYGTEFMKIALSHCFANPMVAAVWVDPLESNRRVHSFYESLGFSYVEHRWFDKDYCRVYRIGRASYSEHHG